jgi:hypothetical protein
MLLMSAPPARASRTRSSSGPGPDVSVEVDSDPASSERQQVQLTYGCSRRIVMVDHETFMDEEFFRTLVLHQIEAAINELAGSA